MNRRNFLSHAGLTMGVLAMSRYTSLASVLENSLAYDVRMISNNLGIFTEMGGTIAFLLTKEGVIIVDSQFPDPAKHLIDDLKKRTDKPLNLLINTHHHYDHTSGNPIFKGLVKNLVAHQNAAINLKNVHAENLKSGKKVGEQYFPDLTFDKKWKYKLGGDTVKAYYFGAAHTNGDAMIHFPNHNAVHMGDLVFNRRYPYIDKTAGANIKSWISVLDKAMDKFGAETKYIFGHAYAPEKIVGSQEDLKAFQNYLEKLLEFVGKQIKAGKSKEEIMMATSIPGAEEWQGDGIKRSLDAAYQELS